MGKKKESHSSGEHSTAKRAAVASAGAIAAAAAVVGTVKVIHDKQKKVSQSPDYARNRRLKIFSAFGSTPEEQRAIARADIFKDGDMVKAEIAVRVCFATLDTARTITAKRLREALSDTIDESEFTAAIKDLENNELIGKPDVNDGGIADSEEKYRAFPALVRAVEDRNYSILAEAEAKILFDGLNQSDTF